MDEGLGNLQSLTVTSRCTRMRPAAGSGDQCPLAELCNAFLTHHTSRVRTGDLAPRALADYIRAADILIGTFGKCRAVVDEGDSAQIVPAPDD